MAVPWNKSKADQLKVKGNEHYQRKEYQVAYDYYTSAIELDPEDAIYYANRAAASWAMKDYLDAGLDAQKAIELNPKYVKAWARLASVAEALSLWERAEKACRSCLECLPPEESMSAKDKSLKSEMDAILEKAIRHKNDDEEDLFKPIKVEYEDNSKDSRDLPWFRALAKRDELVAQAEGKGTNFSNGLVILQAYYDYRDGMEKIMNIKISKENGNTKVVGRLGGVTFLVHALLIDPRIFYEDRSVWIEKYNHQVIFECQYYKGWERGDADLVLDEATKRLKNNTWKSVQYALEVTVHAWILAGFNQCAEGFFVKSRADELEPSGLELFERAIKLLEVGRVRWHDVYKRDLSDMFDKGFIRKVKLLYLTGVMRCIGANKANGLYTLQDLMEQCRELIKDVEADKPDPHKGLSAYIYAAYWMYPKGEAYGILAWSYIRLGFASDNNEDKMFNFLQAIEHYAKASSCVPRDEEHRATFLRGALEAYWYTGAPVGETLKMCKAMRSAIAEMKPIWEKCPGWKLRDRSLQPALEYELDASRRVLEGTLSLSDVYIPEFVKYTNWAHMQLDSSVIP